MSSVSVVDYIIFTISIITSLSIGVVFACVGDRQTSSLEYFLGGKRMHYVPVAISMLVTYESSILMLGSCAEVYTHGIMFALTAFGQSISLMFVVLITIPLFYKLQLTSIFHYFVIRFPKNSSIIRLALASLTILYNVFYTGIVLIGPALAVEALTGIDSWISATVFAVVAVMYTSIGGMRAVIWTDVFQGLVMISGILAVIIQGTKDAGGIEQVYKMNRIYGRLELFNFNPDPTIRHTFWTIMIGSFVTNTLKCFSQQTVQRLSSTETITFAKKVMYVYIPMYLILQLLTKCTGLISFAHFAIKGCDPLASRQIENSNQVLVVTVQDLFGNIPGMTGLFMAAIISAAFSTISSSLNSLSAITCEEFIKPKFSDMSDKRVTFIAKISVVCYGCSSIAVYFLLRFVKGSLSQLFNSIMGSIGGPYTGVFVLAVFFKRATVKGVLSGAMFGFVIALWLSLGYNLSPTLPKTPWLPLGPTHKCPSTTSPNTFFLNESLVLNRYISKENHYTPTMAKGGNNEPVSEPLLLNETDTTLNITQTDSVIIKSNIQPSQEHVDIVPSSTKKTSTHNHAYQRPNRSKISGLDHLYSISYQYFSVISTLVTIIVGIVASLITQSKVTEPINTDCMLAITDVCCCCIPRLTKRKTSKTRRASKSESVSSELQKCKVTLL